MDLDFQRHCHKTLTGNQFAVFSVLHSIGPCLITQADLAEIMSSGTKRISFHMTALKRMDFIAYEPLGWVGLDLYWVKTAPGDKPPASNSPLVQQYRWRLKHESGTLARLKRGEIEEFARQHQLRADSVRNLLNGIWKQYKGWTLDS